MNILDVIYNTAHKYKGGIPALAVRMGKSPNVLQNKVNPNCDTHHVTAEEAAQIADFADCDEIAKAYAERRNMVCVPVATHQGVSDMELLDLVMRMEKEKGDWLDSIRSALSDGAIDTKEFERIRKEGMEHMAVIAELTCRIEGMVQERKPVRAIK